MFGSGEMSLIRLGGYITGTHARINALLLYLVSSSQIYLLVQKLIQKRRFLLCTIPPLLMIPATVALGIYAWKIGPPNFLLFIAVVLLLFCAMKRLVNLVNEKHESNTEGHT